jgi:copper/silver efflux system protein
MIKRIIDFSAHNKFLVILLTLVALAAAAWCFNNMPLDAIPDLSDTQVVVYSRWDRSPDVIEAQVTYPIVSAILGTPRVKAVRGVTDFGYSYVYVIFEDGTDLYWARSRVLEYLSKLSGGLPAGVRTELGPDATSVGWVYQYALLDQSGKLGLADLRSLQDWQLRYQLQSVPGVAEVAPVGGFVKQYQISLDPNRLMAYGLTVNQVVEAVRANNNETGGRLIEFAGREYMIRGRGYLQSTAEIENIAVKTDSASNTPVLIAQLGSVQLGPDMRRGLAELNGVGEAVGGIIVMRQGENVNRVIARVKAKLEELAPSLPAGVKIVPVYDRSDLVNRAINTLKDKLTHEMIIVSLVILFFLWHLPSAMVPIITIPVSVALAFIPMYFMGITTNIMSLSGIAISIGVLVDGAIIEVENAYKKLEIWLHEGGRGDPHEIRLNALKEVGPAVFFSLLVVAVSFLPIFTLIDEEGRLFKPLAISKTLAMALAALLALTLDPAVRMLFTRMEKFKFRPGWLAGVLNRALVGTYYREKEHPVSRVLFAIYTPAAKAVLRFPRATIALSLVLALLTVPAFLRLGSEFMPPLNEEAFLYMPTAFPGMSVTQAKEVLTAQDRIIKSFAEVQSVFGKAGRAETATDPAPFSMIETTIVLKPVSEWPKVARFYSNWPKFIQPYFEGLAPAHRSYEELRQALNQALKLPGMPNIWTMPIKNRIDMLATGIRTPLGIKVLGPDLNKIQEISEQIESAVKNIPGTGNVFAERTADGFYLDISPRREDLSRYGVTLADLQMTISSAIGGENISTTIEGLGRYPINVRYARDFREDLDSLARVLVPTSSGAQIPISLVANISLVKGPAMIRNEGGYPAGYIYVDISGRDLGGYVQEAKDVVASKVQLPGGYNMVWSGQYENMQRVKERLKLIVPLTLFVIALLIYLNTGSAVKTGVVMLAVPFSLIGAVWLLYILGYHLSIAVWVGMIALMGLDAETGIFMLLYLDLAHAERQAAGRLKTLPDLKESIIEGAVHRIRPKLMTVTAAFMGLLPIMFTSQTGGDLMKRIAAPMVGGLVTSFLLELLVYPAIYLLLHRGDVAQSRAG